MDNDSTFHPLSSDEHVYRAHDIHKIAVVGIKSTQCLRRLPPCHPIGFMTLVAGFSCGGPPAFVGDLLTSWGIPSTVELPVNATEATIPTGAKMFAAGLAQKLIIVRPYLLIAWAGSASEVHELVRKLNQVLPEYVDDLRDCADSLFRPLNELTRDVEVVAIVIDGHWIRPYCVHTRWFELDDRRYYLLGTGVSTAYSFWSRWGGICQFPIAPRGLRPGPS